MDQILSKYSQSQIDKARNIKALVFDVDGVLTDGKISYTNTGDEIKSFNVKDGQVIKLLKNAGIIVGAITGRQSEIVDRRSKELKLDFHYQGAESKSEKLEEVKKKFRLKDEEIAYIGDDIIDLKLIINVGFGISPRDAVSYVSEKADLITTKNGGDGVVREVADMILAAQNKLEEALKAYID